MRHKLLHIAAFVSFIAIPLTLGLAAKALASGPSKGTTTEQTTAPATATTATATEITKLQDDVDKLKGELRLVFIVGGVVLGGGVAIGFVTAVRTERRTSQAFELAIAGETAAQSRAEQTHTRLLDSSQKTLDLVNDTLGLAKEASERANETLTLRAKRNVERLDAEAQEALRPALIGNHFKVLVEKPERQRDVFEVAGELASIEGYLEFQDVELTAPCLFVRGMERYIRQEPRAAIKYFREALRIANREQDRDLTALALYWLGYQSNNLGQFGEALERFRRAEDFVDHDTARHIEIQRIGLETRIFQLAADQLRSGAADSEDSQITRSAEIAESVITRLDELITLDRGSSESDEVGRALYQTKANVHVWLARQYELSTDRGDDAWAGTARAAEITHLCDARDGFAAASAGQRDVSLWPRFGELEASHRLHELTSSVQYEVTEEDYAAVAEKAIDQLSVRVEPRSLASLNETRLIAEARRVELAKDTDRTRDREEAYKATMTALNQVDHDLFLFSQRLKVNVSWDLFESEVKAFNQLQRGPKANRAGATKQ